jgi:REP element-mobilizing transposase RayT
LLFNIKIFAKVTALKRFLTGVYLFAAFFKRSIFVATKLMADKYQNKYRIPSARLPAWDYSCNGEYFITICTANRKHYFGEIINGIMHLSEQGKKAYQCWLEIPEHFSFVSLDEFVVMPNHTHGIIVIDKPWDYNWGDAQISPGVETGHALSLPNPIPPHPRFRNQGINTISSMVGSFKSALSNWCNENKYPFGWQTRFHDHIIRNKDEFHRIRNYIINNPANWEQDKFFKLKKPPLP